MSTARLDFRGGVDVELSATANRGGWSSSNLIRFREGKPEKMRGWQRQSDAMVGPGGVGVCRSMHWWTDLSRRIWLALGINTGLQIFYQGNFFAITPLGYAPGLPSSAAAMPYTLRIWSLDNFGEFLLAVPSNGPLYVWMPTLPLPGTLATLVAGAPALSQGMFVANPQQIVVAYGASAGSGTQRDPLLLRWSDQSDYTDWTVTTTNQAGSFRLSRGSRIIGGINAPLGALIWTDLDIWSMTYQGFPLVWNIQQLSQNCGLIAQGAVGMLGGNIYWMSDHGFFTLGPGGAVQIPCTVWDFVYLDLDDANADKCIAAPNFHFSEIAWYFPSKSGGTGEIDSYVKYNIAENKWDFGRSAQYARTAWTDQNQNAPPFSVDLPGHLQQQDIGFDADGEPMAGVSVISGFADMADGGMNQRVRRFYPDFLFTDAPESALEVSLLIRYFEGDTPQIVGPFTVTPQTRYITLNARGREVALQIASDAAATWWRVGTPRMRVQPAGSRP